MQAKRQLTAQNIMNISQDVSKNNSKKDKIEKDNIDKENINKDNIKQ